MTVFDQISSVLSVDDLVSYLFVYSLLFILILAMKLATLCQMCPSSLHRSK